MNAQKCGDFIAELRKEQNLTQKDLADKINVSDKAISRWETGKGFPDVDSLQALSKFFNITINELLAGEKAETKTVEEIENYAFVNTSLTSLTFEEGIEEISGEGNFCSTKLEHITLPASIKKIGNRPFAPNLKTVTFLGDAPEITREDPFRFITPEDTEIREVVIKYDKNTKGWDTTPLRDNYTLEAY